MSIRGGKLIDVLANSGKKMQTEVDLQYQFAAMELEYTNRLVEQKKKISKMAEQLEQQRYNNLQVQKHDPLQGQPDKKKERFKLRSKDAIVLIGEGHKSGLYRGTVIMYGASSINTVTLVDRETNEVIMFGRGSKRVNQTYVPLDPKPLTSGYANYLLGLLNDDDDPELVDSLKSIVDIDNSNQVAIFQKSR
jgi:hypothetical protein